VYMPCMELTGNKAVFSHSFQNSLQSGRYFN